MIYNFIKKIFYMHIPTYMIFLKNILNTKKQIKVTVYKNCNLIKLIFISNTYSIGQLVIFSHRPWSLICFSTPLNDSLNA